MDRSNDPARLLRDELLVVRCQLGEHRAFEELVRTWSGPLLRHVQRMAGTDVAEDVVQEVWIRALRGIARLRDGGKLRAWLFGISHHVVMDRLRGRYVEREARDGLADEPLADVPETFEPLLDLLDERMNRLPLVERETLSLFYLENLSLLQIAEIQCVPVGTVKSRLFRARAMLRQSMLKGANDEG